MLITPVDVAIRMVVLWLVQWVYLAEVITDWRSMVGDDIDHDIHALLVSCVDQALEVIL